MIVMKFGGTSVGSAARIMATTDIIAHSQKPAIVVVSAMSGITNRLEAVARGNDNKESIIDAHLKEAALLGIDVSEFADCARGILEGAHTESEIKACGEQLSSALIIRHMRAIGMDAVLLDALSFMRLNEDGYPDTPFLKKHLADALQQSGPHAVYLTQGFICRDAAGHVSTLSRGGSDYTATLLGEAAEATEIQIWTDVNGVYTADPRIVAHAQRIPHLNYGIADYAASFGAKILHRACVSPAWRNSIPIMVLDSFHPDAPGTVIGPKPIGNGFKIVASITYPEQPNMVKVSLIGHDYNINENDIRKIVGNDINIVDAGLATYMMVPRHKEKETIVALHDNFVTSEL